MNILTQSELFSPEEIAEIEKHYSAKYICETCLRAFDQNWSLVTVAVFYQADTSKIPEGGSQWFGLYFHTYPDTGRNNLMITNALSALEPFNGVVAENGDVIYSRNRHDYRTSPDGSVWIDGGRDYVRHGGKGKIVRLAILKDGLYMI